MSVPKNIQRNSTIVNNDVWLLHTTEFSVEINGETYSSNELDKYMKKSDEIYFEALIVYYTAFRKSYLEFMAGFNRIRSHIFSADTEFESRRWKKDLEDLSKIFDAGIIISMRIVEAKKAFKNKPEEYSKLFSKLRRTSNLLVPLRREYYDENAVFLL